MDRKVVIIGAGISGLSAACRLNSAGVKDITILEAENHIGGRVRTVDCDGCKLELGAQWIHGTAGNAVYELLSKDVELLHDDNDDPEAGEVFFASGKPVSNKIREVFDKSRELITKMEIEAADRVQKYGESSAHVKDVSLFHIAEKGWNQDKFSGMHEADTSVILKNVLNEMSIADGDSLDRLGCAMYYHFIEYPGGDIKIPGGYSILLKKLCEKISDSAIKLNCKVKSVVWNETQKSAIFDQNRTAKSGWNANILPGVHSTNDCFTSNFVRNEMSLDGNALGFQDSKPLAKNGGALGQSRKVEVEYLDESGKRKIISADHVIVTVSLGCLKKHHKTLLLPNFTSMKQNYLEILGFSTVNKIILYYRKPFWGDDEFCLFPLWDHFEGTDDFADDNHWCRHLHRIHTFQRNCILAWANADASEKIRHLSKTEIKNTIVALIQRCKSDVIIPQPDEVIITYWAEQENFLGSYSCTRIGETLKMKRKVFEPLTVAGVPRVLFAGEATHESRFSTVDGAYETGIREADRLLKIFK